MVTVGIIAGNACPALRQLQTPKIDELGLSLI
jgi:hypothetical protein